MSMLSNIDRSRLQRAIDMLIKSDAVEHPFDAQVIEDLARVAGSTGFCTAGRFVEWALTHPISVLLRWLLFMGADETPGDEPVSDVPSGISCSQPFAQTFGITWVNGSNPRTGNEVWLNVSGSGYFLAYSVGAAATSQDDGPYGPGEVVCGKVRAVNGSSVSAFSDECCQVF